MVGTLPPVPVVPVLIKGVPVVLMVAPVPLSGVLGLIGVPVVPVLLGGVLGVLGVLGVPVLLVGVLGVLGVPVLLAGLLGLPVPVVGIGCPEQRGSRAQLFNILPSDV